MESKQCSIGGCRQAATKNTIKTAKIKFNDKSVKATRRLKNDERAAAEDNTISNNRQISSLWPINVKNYKNNRHKNNNNITITNKHRRGPDLLLLITMSVLMLALQIPSPTTAATVMRIRDTQHLTHHSSSSAGDGDTDINNRSVSSNDMDDIVEIILKKGGGGNSKRIRKTKRHSDDFYLLHHKDESATDLEWANPCSGVFQLSQEANSVNPPPSYFLAKLRKVSASEFHTINDTMHTIDISDMATWSKYRRYYSFLPKISLDSNIALKRWYRHMQTYVATFAYLGRTQYKWDRSKRMSTSGLTHELNQLLLSARSILCEIETTINGSYPYPSNKKKLTLMTRDAMNKKLRFITKRRVTDEHSDEAIEPEMLDLQFAKSKYYHYLRRLWRVIRMKTKRISQKKLAFSSSNESSASSSFSATIEDFISSDINDLRLHQRSSSSGSGSLEYSNESNFKRKKRPKQNGMQHNKETQNSIRSRNKHFILAESN